MPARPASAPSSRCSCPPWGLDFTLDTTIGPIDILGEIVAGGRYDDLASFSGATAHTANAVAFEAVRHIRDVRLQTAPAP